jgi:glycerol-3-phosphate acyltransferase PlsX
MNNKIIIAIDAMGGENAPCKNIEGVFLFLKKNKNKNDVFFNLYGNEILIKKEISKYKISANQYKIYPSSTVVSDEETPLTAIKNSKDSSMWNSINSQIVANSNITLSAGNTGVLFVVSRMLLKTIDSVSKPALAGLWPNKKNMNVVLDLGANVECDEKNLVDFSEMGSALYKALFPTEVPKVALLNIGSEEIKGTEILKKTHTKLKEISKYGDFEFNGFIEGNKITEGKSNVIVTDGFTGNIALKTAEGTAKFITDSLKESLASNIFAKISVIFSFFALKKFKEKLDPRKFNGAIFLGLKGPVVKSHGSTDAIGFYHSIDLCHRIIKGDLVNKIKNNLSHLNEDGKKS